MNAWSHLPNAAVIDEVLESLRKQPKAWDTAWDAAWDAARGAARDAARGAARDAAWDTAWDAARGAAWGALAALIAYDDAGHFMKRPVGQLKAMHRLDPHPMYLLLQPAAVIFAGDVQ